MRDYQEPTAYRQLSLIQRRFIETLTDEDVQTLNTVINVFRYMDADTLALIRNPRAELIQFLSDMRPEEIAELRNSIELVRSFRRTWRVIKGALVTFVGSLIAVAALWDKIAPWFKGTPK